MKDDGDDNKQRRPARAKLSAEETLKRMEAFPERKEAFIAAVRQSKELKMKRPKRAEITRKQAIKFMEDFPNRKEAFIAANRRCEG